MFDIYRYFICKETDDLDTKRKKRGYLAWFLSSFPEKEFEGEDRAMYLALKVAYSIKAPFTFKYLEVFCVSDLKKFIAKYRIRIEQTASLSYDDLSQLQEATQTIRGVLKQEFDKMSNMEVNLDDFVIDMKEWMCNQKHVALMRMWSEGSVMLKRAVGRQADIGDDDAIAFTAKRSGELLRLYSDEVLSEIAHYRDENNLRLVCYTGVPSVDNDMRGLYTTELYTIAAGPGVGKTSFTIGMISYDALIRKQNVAIFSLEQPEKHIRAYLVARHALSINDKLILDTDLIRKDKYPEDSEEYKLMKIAEYDLFDSGKYGHVYIRGNNHDFYLEDMESIFDQAIDREGPFDLIILDHMAIIQQNPEVRGPRLSIGERAQEAYINYKKYLSRHTIAGIAINQLNATGANAAQQGKELPIDSYAGGMETLRSSDYVLVLGMTTQQKAAKRRSAYSTKARSQDGAAPFVMQFYTTCAFFKELVDNAVYTN